MWNTHLIQVSYGVDEECCIKREQRNDGGDRIKRDPEETKTTIRFRATKIHVDSLHEPT